MDASARPNKTKELLARHTDLEQSQNKAQGALLSVLALTQVTELKILLDVGTDRHKLYNFVLALLIGSIALQIIVGVIVIYIGHLRYQKEPGNRSWSHRLAHCLVCTCRPTCCKKKPKKRCPSYISVPIGVGTAEPKVDTMEMSSSQYLADDSDVASGCCDWPGMSPGGTYGGDTARNYVERHQVELEQAKVKLANAVACILRLTNDIEKAEADATKTPRDLEAEKLATELRVDLNIARREKEQADAELALAESRRKQAVTMAMEQEERDEHATFRKIRSWQQVALYLLYFITLMNIFVTAIGISVHG